MILSMTALDILDACSTMEDINDLLRMVGQGEESPDVCGKKLPIRDEVVASLKTNWKSSLGQVRDQPRTVQTGVQFPDFPVSVKTLAHRSRLNGRFLTSPPPAPSSPSPAPA